MDTKINELLTLLPGYNCGACGEKRCDGHAEKLSAGTGRVESCPFLQQERFENNRTKLKILLGDNEIETSNGAKQNEDEVLGLLDGYRADFELLPLPGEPSCRETLFPFSRQPLAAGDIIRYRPMGCPMIHFAKIINEAHGLITVHMIGPMHRINDPDFSFIDVGVCMVGGFEGTVMGKLPFVGQTVRFVPHHCMMRKVHSGVVVQLIGEGVAIEGIDLKVWAPPL